MVQAGQAAYLSYRSWQDFSAAHILGRCLRFDEEEFGAGARTWPRPTASCCQIPAAPGSTPPSGDISG
ncbi:DUF1266 domain-containing protein [Streptomyces sp. NPDC090057]|uniref:DUF1266 domain-containing protein n=1 Tax=Streptomyces sp. NPDC090057 TaxID=3365935 RepID=UPI00382931D3